MLILILEKFKLFHSIARRKLFLLICNWLVIFEKNNNLLRCWGRLSFLNRIGTFILLLILKLTQKICLDSFHNVSFSSQRCIEYCCLDATVATDYYLHLLNKQQEQVINPSSANSTKWSNTFYHFVRFALKGLKLLLLHFILACNPLFFVQIWLAIQSSVIDSTFRSSRRRCSVRNGVLRSITKFTGKHLYQSLFLMKLQAWGLRSATLLKKRLWHRCFPVNFAKFLTPFLQNTSSDCFYTLQGVRLIWMNGSPSWFSQMVFLLFWWVLWFFCFQDLKRS